MASNSDNTGFALLGAFSALVALAAWMAFRAAVGIATLLAHLGRASFSGLHGAMVALSEGVNRERFVMTGSRNARILPSAPATPARSRCRGGQGQAVKGGAVWVA